MKPTTNNLEGWEELYNKGIKELHELTIAIEQAIREGGVEGRVAQDNLSSQFNDKLKQFISDLRKKDMEELIKRVEALYELEEDDGYSTGYRCCQIESEQLIKDYYNK